MSRRSLAHAGAIALTISIASVASVARPARAAPGLAIPAAVRVNVAGLGTASALISSTGTLTVTDTSGAVVYAGGDEVVGDRADEDRRGMTVEPRTLASLAVGAAGAMLLVPSERRLAAQDRRAGGPEEHVRRSAADS